MTTTRKTAAAPTTPWPYFLKRLDDQKRYRQVHGVGPWRCGAGAECLMQGWHDQITGLPRGPVDGGQVMQGDVTAVLHEGAIFHSECLVRSVLDRFAEICPDCGAATSKGGPAAAHRRSCTGEH